MTDTASASLLGPGVAVLDDASSIKRSAFSCSELDKLADEDAKDKGEEGEEEDDEGEEPTQNHSTSEESSTFTMVLVTLFFAGFLAVCAVLVVQMMRADEAAFARRLEQRMPQVQPKHVHVKVSLAQLYTGDHVEINADRTIVCSKCAGTGHDISAGYHECPKCKGTGVSESIEQVGPFQQRVRSVCNICQGRGRIANSKCEVCGGLGLRHESTTLNVHIERGVRHGDELLLAREGDQAPLHIPGHVVVHVTMAPHPVFTRRGDDLELTLEISLLEALVGFSRELSHLDGHTIKLDREAVVQPTTVWTILNEGMPIRQRPGEFGDLLVHFNIAYPSELDAADKSVVCQLLRD